MAVLKNTKYIGGGSLIHKSFVLTSATKVNGVNAADLIARVGEFDFTSTEEVHEDINVKNIIIHEGFILESLRPNNIALLQLAKPVTFGQYINIVCLPPPNVKFDNKLCIATSWGKNKFTDPKKAFPTIILKSEMTIHPKATCETAYNNMKPRMTELIPGIICAGGGDNDTCGGNGGSPLVCAGDNNSYYQVGVVSWGLGCQQSEKPIAYTEVSYYVDWINSKINSTLYT